MSRFKSLHTRALVFASSTLLSAVTLAVLHSQPVKKAALPDSARQVADDLDTVVQPRFQDQFAGVFGTGRITSPVRGHMSAAMFQYLSQIESKSTREDALLRQANAARRDYIVNFLHCAHVPGKFKDPPQKDRPTHDPYASAQPSLSTLAVSPSVSAAWQAVWKDSQRLSQARKVLEGQQMTFQKAATADLPQLRQGLGQAASVGNWLVVMRPVRALQDSCLNCHTGAKRGDTLGVMVYAVSKESGAGG